MGYRMKCILIIFLKMGKKWKKKGNGKLVFKDKINFNKNFINGEEAFY